jgi:AraC-like DNA-binding protein
MSGAFDVGGALSIQFQRHQGIKCYAIVSGCGWLTVESVPEPIRLQTGDCFLLPRGLPFCLATDLDLPPIDYRSAFSSPRCNGSVLVINEGGRCMIAGGHFTFAGDAAMLIELLPPVVHIRKESDRAAMRWSLERMMQELHNPQPGSTLVAQQLAYLMLIQALRLHLEEGLRNGVGWLFALADPQMNAAITCMHSDPGHPWTLQELAGHVGMSRSIFAQRFKETVGESPIHYLTRWRMRLAADRLANTRDSISQIAQSLGYVSESAFSKAFRRCMACSPSQFSRNTGPSPRPSDPEGQLAATRAIPVPQLEPVPA